MASFNEQIEWDEFYLCKKNVKVFVPFVFVYPLLLLPFKVFITSLLTWYREKSTCSWFWWSFPNFVVYAIFFSILIDCTISIFWIWFDVDLLSIFNAIISSKTFIWDKGSVYLKITLLSLELSETQNCMCPWLGWFFGLVCRSLN